MKTKTKLIMCILAFSILIINSCSSTYIITPPYADVDELLSLQPGQTIADVNIKLGIKPYDIYTIQNDGSTILHYHYRIKSRRVKVPGEQEARDKFVHGETFQKSGDVWFNDGYKSAFLLFKEGKFKSMITESGIENGEMIIVYDGRIRAYSKEEFDKLSKFLIGYAGNDSVLHIIDNRVKVQTSQNTTLITGSSEGGGSKTGVILGGVSLVGILTLLLLL